MSSLPRHGRVLVTGATGFVGSALVAELIQRGYSVTAAVRRPARLPAAVRVVVVGEAHEDGPVWDRAFQGVSCVVHCAARVHVQRDTARDPLAAYRSTNVNATIALANAAAARRVKRFIFLSSIKAVNESSAPGRPLRPEDPPSPSDPYGISKLEAERALLAVGARNGLEIVIVRPPLVYGPGVRANFLSMSRWIALGIPLPLGGLTENRRSFVALDNLLDLIVRCLWHPASPFTTFHVSDGEDLSTAELLRRTALAMGRSPRLLPVPVTWLARGASLLRQSDRWRRLGGTLQVDITQTRERLGWTPTVSIEEGLRRAVGGSARPSVCR